MKSLTLHRFLLAVVMRWSKNLRVVSIDSVSAVRIFDKSSSISISSSAKGHTYYNNININH